MNICICGGGGLGHVIAGVAAHRGFTVSVLTRRPEEWNSFLRIDDGQGQIYEGKLSAVSSQPAEVVSQADIVLLCLPGFALEEELLRIKPFLQEGVCVGSVVSCTGFFFIASRLLEHRVSLFGFQRAPFIARVEEYGQSASLLGYKKELQLATVNTPQPAVLQQVLQEMLGTPIRLLRHFLEASLTNSNPLLHPARLYSLFHTYSEGQVFDEVPGFYTDWDNASSERLIACDVEFQQILEALPMQIEPIPTLLDYYESYDAASLTRKIRSITAFKHILTPMKKSEQGYLPDFGNRYFLEDFPFGLLIVKSIAEILQIATPHLDAVLLWGQGVLGKEYMKDGQLAGKDLPATGYVSAELFYQLMKA